MQVLTFIVLFSTLFSSVFAHSAFFHPSMWGFNVTGKDFPYDNRPVSPLRGKSFNEWWFHNHLAFPPNPNDRFLLPVGQPATAEIACTKSATSYHASSDGGDIRDRKNPNNPCPGSPTIQFHAHNEADAQGCALAIAYKNKVEDVKPEDFTVFSVNHTCVWNRFTDFQVPKRMPPCPEGGCICSFFWMHSEKGGGEENYMNGFRCDVTGADVNGGAKIAKSRVPRRCGSDPQRGKPEASLGNCTYGAKTPFYWVNDRSNMFEPAHTPPVYNDLYGFADGAQEDIFEDSYITNPLPEPRPGGPIPVLRTTFDSPPTPSVPVPPPASTSSSKPTATSTPPAQPTKSTLPKPDFVPPTACRPKLKGFLSKSGSLVRRQRASTDPLEEPEEEIHDCTSSALLSNDIVGIFGRRLHSPRAVRLA